ncbi:MAG: lysostaphin resistance A-like protein [Tenacibaculum sp.]
MNYIQQAHKGKNQWYHYLAFLALVFFGWQILGAIPLLIVAFTYAKDKFELAKAAENSFTSLEISNNLYLFLIITMFAIGLLFVFIGIKYIHKRTVKSLISGRKKIDWQRFWFGFTIWGFILICLTGIGILLEPEYYKWNFNPESFFILLIISFLYLPLQTSFEELLFRGYAMQGLGILVKNRWFPLLASSLAFGLLHGSNPEAEKLGAISMVFYIGTGLFFGIITLLDEGTELALGLHAANNIVASLFVTTSWSALKTDALFIDTSEPSAGFEMFLLVFVLYPLILFVLSKKYGWKISREKLFKLNTSLRS